MRPGTTTQTGFSLVELNIAMTIGTFIMAAVVSSYLVSVQGFQAVSNYAEIHRNGREAVNYFAKDMRAVYSITSFNGSNITVRIPTVFGSTGLVLSNKTVSYTYTGGGIYRYDSSTGYTDMLATNVYFLQYRLYDHIGSNTTLTSVAKSIGVEIRLRKSVVSLFQTEDFISARLDMRNKP